MANKKSLNKKRFAAKYNYKWQGWIAVVFGISVFINVTEENIFPLFSGSFLIALGVFLLRGEGQSPRSLESQEKKLKKLEDQIQSAKKILEASSGGKAVVAYRRLESLFKAKKDASGNERFQEILREMSFDKSKVESVHLGTIPSAGIFQGKPVEVYKDWIISGEIAYDVDSSTRADVNVEGSITVDNKGKKHDMRTASVQFASTSWAHTFPLSISHVSDARRIIGQLAAITETLKPRGVTSDDIASMIDTILSNTGQAPAEKLKQLSDLRYQRLVSDAEFEIAKARILGL